MLTRSPCFYEKGNAASYFQCFHVARSSGIVRCTLRILLLVILVFIILYILSIINVSLTFLNFILFHTPHSQLLVFHLTQTKTGATGALRTAIPYWSLVGLCLREKSRDLIFGCGVHRRSYRPCS